MSHDVLISITTKDIFKDDDTLLGETVQRGYDKTTWLDIMDEMLYALRGAGFYPSREGFEDWVDHHFQHNYPTSNEEDECNGCTACDEYDKIGT